MVFIVVFVVSLSDCPDRFPVNRKEYFYVRHTILTVVNIKFMVIWYDVQ